MPKSKLLISNLLNYFTHSILILFVLIFTSCKTSQSETHTKTQDLCNKATTIGDYTKIPQAVRIYMESSFKHDLEEINELKKQFNDFEAGLTLLFFQKIVDYKDTISIAWLLGYRLGVINSHAPFPVEKVLLINEDGNLIFRLHLETEGTENGGFIIQIAPKAWTIVVSWDGGRPDYTGGVSIFKACETRHEMLRYVSEADPGWYSVLYFKDIDGDGVLEILVERELRYFSKRNFKRDDYLAYKLNEKSNKFEIYNLPKEKLSKLISDAKKDPSVMSISQSGPPYEDHGDYEEIK